jgi:hypothetical protein
LLDGRAGHVDGGDSLRHRWWWLLRLWWRGSREKANCRYYCVVLGRELI